MVHPNEAMFRRLLDTWGSGDRVATAGFFTEDAIFSYACPGPLRGDYQGRKEIMRFWADQDRYSANRFQPDFIDLVAGDLNVFLLVRIGAADIGHAWRRVVVYTIFDGMIVSARVFEDDPAAAEAFFSQGK